MPNSPDRMNNARALRFMGIVGLISAASLAFVAIAYQAPWWSRAIVFAPLWLAGVGLLSAHGRRRALVMAAALTILLIAM
jgi:hypothetical protein